MLLPVPVLRIFAGLYHLVEGAVVSRDPDIVNVGLGIPGQAAVVALDVGSNELWEQAVSLVFTGYRAALRSDASSSARQSQIAGGISSALAGVARGAVSSVGMDQPLPANDVVRTASYRLRSCLQAANHVLKLAVDAGDQTMIRRVGAKLSALVRNTPFEPDEARRLASGDLYEHALGGSSHQDPSGNGQGGVSAGRTLSDEAERIADLQQAICFGLAAWACDGYTSGRVRSEIVESIIEPARQTHNTMATLISAYKGVLAIRGLHGDPLGWENWFEKQEDEVPLADVFRKLDSSLQRWYMVMGTCLYGSAPVDEQLMTPDIAGVLVQANASKLADELAGQAMMWQVVLPDFSTERLRRFVDLHRQADTRFRAQERQRLIEAPLDAQRVEHIKQGFYNDLGRMQGPRRAFDLLGAYSEASASEVLDPSQPMAVRVSLHKQWLVDTRQAQHVGNLGGLCANAMANAEIYNVLRLIATNVQQRVVSTGPNILADLVSELAVATGAICQPDSRTCVIWASAHLIHGMNVLISSDLVLRRSRECEPFDHRDFLGRYRGIPVLSADQGNLSGVLVANLRRLCSWVQYNSPNGNPHGYDLDVTVVDRATAERRVMDQRRVLDESQKKEEIENLQMSADVLITSYFRLTFHDKSAGCYIVEGNVANRVPLRVE